MNNSAVIQLSIVDYETEQSSAKHDIPATLCNQTDRQTDRQIPDTGTTPRRYRSQHQNITCQVKTAADVTTTLLRGWANCWVTAIISSPRNGSVQLQVVISVGTGYRVCRSLATKSLFYGHSHQRRYVTVTLLLTPTDNYCYSVTTGWCSDELIHE